MTNKEIKDILEIEGVGAKGGGVLAKYAMLDTDLTLEAKTIYAYFCSMAGSGKTAFPGRETILEKLGIGKNAYYRHLNLLKEQNYITVIQQKAQSNPKFKRNIYYIVSNPKKFSFLPKEKITDTISRICHSGLKAGGYGYIPYLVMIDTRLDIKAKGIYAYLCTYTGAGDYAFPQKDNLLYHLGISHATYIKYMQQLTELNYIAVVRRRNSDGTLGRNDYYINDTPSVILHASPEYRNRDTVLLPEYKNGDTVSSPEYKNGDTVSSPEYKNRDTVLTPEYKKPDTENRDNNITSINITNNSSSYCLLYTSDYCDKTYGGDKQYTIIYNLLMAELDLIPPEDDRMAALIQNGQFKIFCDDIIQRYAQASKTRNILHPQRYMHKYIINALTAYALQSGSERYSVPVTSRATNRFYNFEQRRDVDYDALMLDNVKEWMTALTLENENKK